MDTRIVLALEPLSTILPGNYQHLQHPQALDRPTLFLGDRSQEHTVPRRLCLGDSAQEALPRSAPCPGDSAQEHTVPRSRMFLGDSAEERG
jgi:hypothetical protein